MFSFSESNSIKDHAALLERLQCEIFLASIPHTKVTEAILSERPMQTFELPDLEFWLQESKVPIYKYEKTFEEARLDPFAILQSSGTSEAPKEIVLKHESCSPFDSDQLTLTLGGESFQVCHWKGKRVLTSFPWDHSAGLLFLLPMAIYNDFIAIVLPPTSRSSVISKILAGPGQTTTMAKNLELSRDKSYLPSSISALVDYWMLPEKIQCMLGDIG